MKIGNPDTEKAQAAFTSAPITSPVDTITRVEYVVMVPRPEGVVEARAYPEVDEDGDDGRMRAVEHIAFLHEKARGRDPVGSNPRWGEAYAIKRTTTTSTQRL